MNVITAAGQPPPASQDEDDVASMQAARSALSRKPARDHRIDALRGVALTMMFCDHIPQNLLNRFTLRNLGFCDAAEVFVLLAGFASMLAYGRAFEREPPSVGLSRLARRVGRLYVFQTGMLIATVIMVRSWRHYHTVPVDFLEPELAYGVRGLWRVLTLEALPGNLNILPLYMVLLILFPVIWLALRFNQWVGLAISAALWLLVNLDPQLNLPNWFDPDGWYFDPFAWQFLFTIGAWSALATRTRGGNAPRKVWLVGLCCLYLAFSCVQAFPWAVWGLPDLSPLPIDPPLKTPLSPLRLIDVLAIFYLVQSSQLARRVAGSSAGQVMAVFGRHSLEVFSLGTVLDLAARLVMTTYGTAWPMQIAVNVIGLGTLYAVATALDRRKQAARRDAARSAPDPARPARDTAPLQRTRARRLGPEPLRLVAFGSSTTEGSGSSGPAHTYPAVLRDTLLPAFPGGIVLVNLGIGGNNARDMDRRLADVIAAAPDLVLWQTGSNDPLQDVPLAEFDRLTRAGIDRLAATGADLAFVDQQFCRALEECPDFDPFLDRLHRIAGEAGLPVFPRYRRMLDWCAPGAGFTRDTLSPDGLHMTDPGYALLGRALAAWLLERS